MERVLSGAMTAVTEGRYSTLSDDRRAASGDGREAVPAGSKKTAGSPRVPVAWRGKIIERRERLAGPEQGWRGFESHV
jgi:hypothetical protein